MCAFRGIEYLFKSDFGRKTLIDSLKDVPLILYRALRVCRDLIDTLELEGGMRYRDAIIDYLSKLDVLSNYIKRDRAMMVEFKPIMSGDIKVAVKLIEKLKTM